ncbi:MAG TPA: tRNA pseudouridine(38-40) synthase TruA [Thermodesulfovibrionales bacterium]|nr:tRNA pseudouridine(38-40) synthase TruA [Thermodesulfovibrionales bacterium]
MRRIRLKLQYDGSAYNGWQVQPLGTTIQGMLQHYLHKLTGEKSAVIGAGRTDAGVHAVEQIAAFESHSKLHTDVIKRALNAMLPPDIRITDADEVDENFHPRYSARRKRYFYMIANMTEVPVFLHKWVWHVTADIDVEAMRTGSAYLPGNHDFSSFRGSGCGARNPMRTVYRIEIEKPGEVALFTRFHGNFIKITAEADGFLRHMVRNIVGTLVEVGRGKISPQKVSDILKAKDRRLAGPTAPPQGLFLEKVIY